MAGVVVGTALVPVADVPVADMLVAVAIAVAVGSPCCSPAAGFVVGTAGRPAVPAPQDPLHARPDKQLVGMHLALPRRNE